MENKIPEKMHAVLLKGHGGFDKLDYRTDIAVPMQIRTKSSFV